MRTLQILGLTVAVSLLLCCTTVAGSLTSTANNAEVELVETSGATPSVMTDFWDVTAAGGNMATAGSIVIIGTIGQNAIGNSAASNISHRAGFYQDFTSVCDCRVGDATGNGTINILDVSYIINYLYKGGPQTRPYSICSGDANCNCVINILDVSYLINYLYKGGTPPCDCGIWISRCGWPN
ncbi:conserved exported hypothetical protein [Candidatus Zixiibacteriota bacterium]|nr:conserved exported hypothetical protein [candidate division Zixibacteria bacterium]